MQQHHHQKFKMVTGAGFAHLFRPSSDRALFEVKENPQNRRNLKMGTRLYIYLIIMFSLFYIRTILWVLLNFK